MIVRIDTERSVLCRHNIKVYDNIVEQRRILRHPTFAVVVGYSVCSHDRELVANRLLVKCLDFFNGCPRIATAATGVNLAGIFIRILPSPPAQTAVSPPTSIVIIQIHFGISPTIIRNIIISTGGTGILCICINTLHLEP